MGNDEGQARAPRKGAEPEAGVSRDAGYAHEVEGHGALLRLGARLLLREALLGAVDCQEQRQRWNEFREQFHRPDLNGR